MYLIAILEVNYCMFMYEYLQFAVVDLCCEIENTNEEFAFIIPNRLFEFKEENNH